MYCSDSSLPWASCVSALTVTVTPEDRGLRPIGAARVKTVGAGEDRRVEVEVLLAVQDHHQQLAGDHLQRRLTGDPERRHDREHRGGEVARCVLRDRSLVAAAYCLIRSLSTLNSNGSVHSPIASVLKMGVVVLKLRSSLRLGLVPAR